MLKFLKVLFILTFAFGSGYAQKSKIKTIVIDAGHGGKDPGTSFGKLKEKNIALSITLKVGKLIEEELGIKVVYTRKKDVFIPLHERGEIANRNKADLFICIHVNANPYSSKIYGSETYTMGLHKTEENLELAKRENAVILMEDNYKKNYDFDPDSPLAHIKMANYQNAFMKQSLNLASKVEKQFQKSGRKSRGVKQAGFQVLWETTMPGIYIETGYLTNSVDREILSTEAGQQKIAEAIVKAIRIYKEEAEK
ncbi:N-acetylmuramoyl-L-alanine amidase family protein [Emticicia sp. 17c]|uniref:N-acetylmuramoyl-L-alanine amidase family protein n=1 Tax=Emticicia sp. 17c TaxID=3127704 RepID=UPI00301CDA07